MLSYEERAVFEGSAEVRKIRKLLNPANRGGDDKLMAGFQAILPSFISIILSAARARSRLCVTIITVMPPAASERRISFISSARFESRLPVGSSASSIFGEFISARAIATRCISPPESSEGEVAGPVPDAQLH